MTDIHIIGLKIGLKRHKFVSLWPIILCFCVFRNAPVTTFYKSSLLVTTFKKSSLNMMRYFFLSSTTFSYVMSDHIQHCHNLIKWQLSWRVKRLTQSELNSPDYRWADSLARTVATHPAKKQDICFLLNHHPTKPNNIDWFRTRAQHQLLKSQPFSKTDGAVSEATYVTRHARYLVLA